LTEHPTNPILSYARWDRENNRFIVITTCLISPMMKYYINLPRRLPTYLGMSPPIAFDTDRKQYGGSGLFNNKIQLLKRKGKEGKSLK
jgi:hypothetical protein